MHWRLRRAAVFFLSMGAGLTTVALAQSNVLAPATRAPQALSSPPAAVPRLRTNGYARGVPLPAGAHSRGTLRAAVTTLFSEAFTGTATTPNAWAYGGNGCITAGNSTTPRTSVPACGRNAPQDAPGQGALELTPPVNTQSGYVFFATPMATSGGLSVTFNEFSFNSSGSPGDGLALVLTDASYPVPRTIGGCCGSLGYAPYVNGRTRQAPLANGYLAVGFDETGYFSAAVEGKTGGLSGLMPNLVTARGAVQSSDQFLLTTTNAGGQPAALPFGLYTASTTRPAGYTMNVTLTATGVLSVAIDRHDGNGLVTYIAPTSIVGRSGQPGVPARVYVGFTSAGGGANARHQINALSVTTAPVVSPPASVLTYHNDINRTGWNPLETTLTTANVNSTTFGLLHTIAVDGRVDAQPLVVPSQPIDGQGIHDALYIATENDTVYTADAKTGTILQSRNLGQSIPNTQKDYDDNIYPVYGILGTPVIDPANDAIYLVTDTNEGVNAPDVYRLHKLALNNLSDLVPSVVLTPSTTLSDGSPYVFPPQHERQHPGLLETNGIIYVAFGSTGDTQPTLSRGIIAGFSAANLSPLASNVVPDRLKELTNPYYLSSIWQSGYGPAADSSGNIYFSTGNSDPGTPSYNPAYNFPDSVLKVSGDLSRIVDSFTQYNYFAQDQADGDFGSGGTLVVPDQPGVYPHLIVAGGKDGRAYILNRDGLGGFTPNGPNRDLAELNSGHCWCGPAYFVGADSVPRLVTAGGNGVTTWRIVDGSSLSLTAEGQVSSTLTDGQPDNGGTIPSISSNGTQTGSAVLWFVQKPNDTNTYTMNLRAFDASNLSHQLFSSVAGNWTNFNSNANSVPTVVNGHVYVGSYKQVQIFGLLGQ